MKRFTAVVRPGWLGLARYIVPTLSGVDERRSVAEPDPRTERKYGVRDGVALRRSVP